MKAEVIHDHDKDEFKGKYPLLVISESGNIILAVSDNKIDSSGFCGVVLNHCFNGFGSLIQGEYSDNWDKIQFKPFTGKITLCND